MTKLDSEIYTPAQLRELAGKLEQMTSGATAHLRSQVASYLYWRANSDGSCKAGFFTAIEKAVQSGDFRSLENFRAKWMGYPLPFQEIESTAT